MDMNQENADLLLKELHVVVENAVDKREYKDIEILTAVLNTLIVSVAWLDVNEQDLLEFINRYFCKNVREVKKLYHENTK